VALAEVLLELGGGEAREQQTHGGHRPAGRRALYNLACLRATAGELIGALTALENAVSAGYSGWDALATDPDLDALRGQERFRRLMARGTGQGGGK
jgi:hypothetical protein